MRVACLGGGPAGLYFAIAMKLRDPAHDIVVVERNRPYDTFGWGVVLSDETLANLHAADPTSAADIRRGFVYWDDIAVHYRGTVTRSSAEAGSHGLSDPRPSSVHDPSVPAAEPPSHVSTRPGASAAGPGVTVAGGAEDPGGALRGPVVGGAADGGPSGAADGPPSDAAGGAAVQPHRLARKTSRPINTATAVLTGEASVRPPPDRWCS